MTPKSREEIYLNAIIGNGDTVPTPRARIELFLQKIFAGQSDVPTPVTRTELFLYKIAGNNVNILPVPKTRVEMYLAKIAGEDIEVPTPKTRVEWFLNEWANGASPRVLTTVTGVTPLVLANAVASSIKSLVQYGKVSTINDEMYCNNGKLVAVHRSGLPSGYKLLEYVGSNGAAYVVTDVYLASTDVVEAEFRNSSTTGYGAIYGIFRLGDSSALYANQTYYGYDESNNKVDTDLRVNTEWHTSRHDFVNGTLTIDDTTVTFTPFEFVNSVQNAVLSRYYNNNYGYVWKGFVRKFKVTRGGEVICDLLPAKNEQDVAGLYDLISGTFYTATGGDLLEGNEVDDYELRVVGTPEVLMVGEQTASLVNLFSTGTVHDEQDIISGTITRRTAVSVSGGVITVSTLAEPTVEHVTAQPMQTAEGNNTVAVTSEIGSVDLSVKYYVPKSE